MFRKFFNLFKEASKYADSYSNKYNTNPFIKNGRYSNITKCTTYIWVEKPKNNNPFI